jgi:hypothetical protein
MGCSDSHLALTDPKLGFRFEQKEEGRGSVSTITRSRIDSVACTFRSPEASPNGSAEHDAECQHDSSRVSRHEWNGWPTVMNLQYGP